jgi:hypothetical protein
MITFNWHADCVDMVEEIKNKALETNRPFIINLQKYRYCTTPYIQIIQYPLGNTTAVYAILPQINYHEYSSPNIEWVGVVKDNTFHYFNGHYFPETDANKFAEKGILLLCEELVEIQEQIKETFMQKVTLPTEKYDLNKAYEKLHSWNKLTQEFIKTAALRNDPPTKEFLWKHKFGTSTEAINIFLGKVSLEDYVTSISYDDKLEEFIVINTLMDSPTFCPDWQKEMFASLKALSCNTRNTNFVTVTCLESKQPRTQKTKISQIINNLTTLDERGYDFCNDIETIAYGKKVIYERNR